MCVCVQLSRRVSVYPYVSLCVSLCVPLCMCACVFAYVCLCVWVWMCYVFFYVLVCLCVCDSVCACVNFSVFVWMCLCERYVHICLQVHFLREVPGRQCSASTIFSLISLEIWSLSQSELLWLVRKLEQTSILLSPLTPKALFSGMNVCTWIFNIDTYPYPKKHSKPS